MFFVELHLDVVFEFLLVVRFELHYYKTSRKIHWKNYDDCFINGVVSSFGNLKKQNILKRWHDVYKQTSHRFFLGAKLWNFCISSFAILSPLLQFLSPLLQFISFFGIYLVLLVLIWSFYV